MKLGRQPQRCLQSIKQLRHHCSTKEELSLACASIVRQHSSCRCCGPVVLTSSNTELISTKPAVATASPMRKLLRDLSDVVDGGCRLITGLAGPGCCATAGMILVSGSYQIGARLTGAILLSAAMQACCSQPNRRNC